MEPKKTGNFGRTLFLWCRDFTIAALAALLVTTTLVVNAIIPTGSMESTVHVGDRVFGNRLAYLFSDPERGDIIIFKFPDDESKLYIKRIVGMPGETVVIIDGAVYINGQETPLDEPYLNEPPIGSYGPYQVPEDCYFVMGDNRNNSLDSRFWNNPYVTRTEIKGQAGLRYYPDIKLVE